MKHTVECIASMEKRQQDFELKAEQDLRRMEAAGIDTSMRGIGYSIRCTCDGNDLLKTQETQ